MQGSTGGAAVERRATVRILRDERISYVVDTGEVIVAVDILQIRIVDIVLAKIGTKLDFMIAQGPVGTQIGILGLGTQDVMLIRLVRAEIEVTVTGRNTCRRVRWQLARKLQGHRWQSGIVFRQAVIVARRNLEFGRETWRPVGKPLSHRRFDRLVLLAPGRAQGNAA